MNCNKMNRVTNFMIEGIHIKDCVCNSFCKTILPPIKTNIVIPTKIPQFFIDSASWITSSNTKCWYCDLNFSSNIPIPIPNAVITFSKGTEKKYKFSVEGLCHSGECVKSYLLCKYTDLATYTDKISMLKEILKILFGKVDVIPEAPSKFMMVHYGGSTSVVDYCKMFKYVIVGSDIKNKPSHSSFCDEF